MRFHAMLALGVAALLAAAARADDDEVAKALSKVAQLGSGPPQAIKKDAKGRITSCVVVGQARVSTVLGKAKGVELARQKAELDAKANFVRWLKEKVSVRQKTEDKATLFLKGSEDNDQETLKESGEAVESSSTRMEAVAEGLVRGFQVLHVEVSDKDKTYTVVMGWSADTARAAGQLRKGAALGDGEGKPGGAPRPGGAKTDKKIEDKKVTSGDAKKFFP